MDISNMTSAYTDIYSSAAQSSQLENTLKGDYAKAQDKELMEACKQFEAYFLEQVFKEMQKTIIKSDDSSDNSLVDYFKDQSIQKIAADSTEQNSLGLAQMLYEQMRRNYGLDPSVVKEIEE